MSTSASQTLSPGHLRYPESYRIVEAWRDNDDYKDALIEHIVIVASPPGDPTAGAIPDALRKQYCTILVLKKSEACLRLEMAEVTAGKSGKSGPPAAVPHRGIISINAVQRETVRAYMRNRETVFTKQIELHPSVKDSYTVKDFMKFLLDSGLLRYRFLTDYPTHCCFWHFWTLFRLAEGKIVVEASSLHLLQEMDKWSRTPEVVVDGRGRNVAARAIDVDNITKQRGDFE